MRGRCWLLPPSADFHFRHSGETLFNSRMAGQAGSQPQRNPEESPSRLKPLLQDQCAVGAASVAMLFVQNIPNPNIVPRDIPRIRLFANVVCRGLGRIVGLPIRMIVGVRFAHPTYALRAHGENPLTANGKKTSVHALGNLRPSNTPAITPTMAHTPNSGSVHGPSEIRPNTPIQNPPNAAQIAPSRRSMPPSAESLTEGFQNCHVLSRLARRDRSLSPHGQNGQCSHQ